LESSMEVGLIDESFSENIFGGKPMKSLGERKREGDKVLVWFLVRDMRW
jgi:hypothetical protein